MLATALALAGSTAADNTTQGVRDLQKSNTGRNALYTSVVLQTLIAKGAASGSTWQRHAVVFLHSLSYEKIERTANKYASFLVTTAAIRPCKQNQRRADLLLAASWFVCGVERHAD